MHSIACRKTFILISAGDLARAEYVSVNHYPQLYNAGRHIIVFSQCTLCDILSCTIATILAGTLLHFHESQCTLCDILSCTIQYWQAHYCMHFHTFVTSSVVQYNIGRHVIAFSQCTLCDILSCTMQYWQAHYCIFTVHFVRYPQLYNIILEGTLLHFHSALCVISSVVQYNIGRHIIAFSIHRSLCVASSLDDATYTLSCNTGPCSRLIMHGCSVELHVYIRTFSAHYRTLCICFIELHVDGCIRTFSAQQ